jgi:ubiquinone/menaquinone biosynthesis C-methylase UbiE
MSMTPAASTYFQQNAQAWDRLRSSYFDETLRDAAIAKAYLRPEMVVADVGAGTGFISAGLAPLVRRVILLDGSSEMLAVARRNLAAFDNLEFETADGLSLPLPDDSVDAVFANMYLHHCPDPLAALHEMARILVPGGRLVLTDMDAHPYTWLKEEMADVWQGFERTQVKDWLRQARLVNRIVACSGSCCQAETERPVEHGGNKQHATISVFIAAGTRRVVAAEVVQAHYTAAVQPEVKSCCSPAPLEQARECCSQNTPVQDSTCCSSAASPQGTACCDHTPPIQDTTCCRSAQAERCCDLVEDPFEPGYSAEQEASAPQEAVEVAFGCGNPTALAALRPAERVLDIGSGGGIDAFLAAAKVGQNGWVIGVDMTPAMINRATASAARNGFTNVEFRLGQADQLPLEDEAVDVVISNCVINLVEDKGTVFEEAMRVLAPGGRLEVSDMLAGGSLPLEARQDAAAWAACLSGTIPEQEYVDLIRQAGFSAVTVKRSHTEVHIGGTPVYSARISAYKKAKINPAAVRK